MAKRLGRPQGSVKKLRQAGVPENVGAALGKVAARLDGWLAQRDDIARELNDVITRAQAMMARIGERDIPWPFKGKRRKVTTPSMVGAAVAATNQKQVAQRSAARKKFTMSEEARKRISAAQKARWAARKAGESEKAKKVKKAKAAGGGAVSKG